MKNMKFKHSFAKVWLKRLGNEIYINGTNFLKVEGKAIEKYFKIRPLKTFLRQGEDLIDEEELDKITYISYGDMKKKVGHTIYRISVPKKKWWYTSQKYIYLIEPKIAGKVGLPESSYRRRHFKIEWLRSENCVRGVGEGFGTREGKYKNGDVTPWVFYKKRPSKSSNILPLTRHKSYADISDNLMKSWKGEKIEHDDKIPIKELPVMITEEGHLLCMPYDKDYVPKMVMVGTSGSGKSWCLNSILGRAFYIYQDKCGLLNDSGDQFYDLMLPQQEDQNIMQLNRIGNKPRPLPVINLYMSCPEVDIRYKDENVGYRLVIDFKDLLRRYPFFSANIGGWKIGETIKYWDKHLINALDKGKTSEEMKKICYAMIPKARDDKQGDGTRSMIHKWVAAWDKVLSDKFTYNLFKDEKTTSPYWKAKVNGRELSGHPFIISAYAGCFPIINNTMAKDRPIASKHLADIIKKISRWQTMMGKDKKRIWIGIDELKDLLGERKNSDVYKALDYLFAQGRFPKIGFIGNLQEYSMMSNAMQNNTTHLIVFDLKKKKERKDIAEDYSLDATRIEEMSKLENHQCLFITKKKMIIYDKDGKRKEKKEGEGFVWKGKILAPITVHKKPSDT